MPRSPIRLVVIGFGMLLVLAGFVAISSGGAGAAFGLYAVVSGLVLAAAAVLERSRYRSTVAEAGADAPGPGGGEPLDEPLEPRFRPTAERFVDPTTDRVMQVWLDAATGERRYRAEG